jgi:uncharacterized protein YkwD
LEGIVRIALVRRFVWGFCLPLIALVTLIRCFPTTTAAAAPANGYQVMVPLVVISIPAPSPAETIAIEVVALTNQLRQKHGCAPLQISPELMAAALGHSQEMADKNYFSHVDLSGHRSGWRAEQAGYTGMGGWENIAAGYESAADVVGGWYNETPPNDGHRLNILNCELTEIGVGYASNPTSDFGTYWTQDFGQR